MPPKARDTSDSLAALQPAQPLRQEPVEPLPVHAALDHRVGRAGRHAPPVGDGRAGGVLALRPDPHGDVAGVGEGGREEVGDHVRIVQGGRLRCRIWRCRGVRRHRSGRRRAGGRGA